MQTIYLDISNRGVIPAIYAKQGDVGRKVEVILTNSGLPYEPEAGSAFSAWFSGASGMGNYTDIGGKSAFAVSGNKVTVELITQMLHNAGEGILCLVLSRANGDQIGLWNIRYICEGVPGAGSEPAKDYYTAFSQAVAGLAYPDASLSVAGKAADAAATGNALKSKAPAGYGLGDIAPVVADLNDACACGWYCGYDAANSPLGRLVLVEVTAHQISWLKQTLWYVDADNEWHTQCVRYNKNDNWTEWEWENPPLVLFEEYRTTERWNGKVVYTMLFDFGAMPGAASAKQVTLPDGLNPGQIIRCEGSSAADVAETFPAYNEGAIIFFARQDNVRCENLSSWNMSYFGAKVRIWYTKN